MAQSQGAFESTSPPKRQIDVDESHCLHFAMDSGLIKRGELDGTPDVIEFAKAVEKSFIDAVDIDSIMTKDLAYACGESDSSG